MARSSYPLSRYQFLQMSLRELLVLVSLTALAIVSLKFASNTWEAIVSGIVLSMFLVAGVVAVIDRGPRQAFAIAFVIVMATYGFAVLNGHLGNQENNNRELNSSGRLPTTRALVNLHHVVDTGHWIDPFSGNPVPSPAVDKATGRVIIGSNGRPASYEQIPPLEEFLFIGHCWAAVLLGYVGGYFGQFVYWRRIREPRSLAEESS
ncbi:MAG TPA: hypothetical protein VHU84_16800 [Lacipirellulaceae bacterium]|jgi:hypothetical protein|nr:hypothetical protein [Lacipirellulaceae bacterium]